VTVSVKGTFSDRQEQSMIDFSFRGRALAGRLFFSVLILLVVCVLTTAGYGLLAALGLVAVVVIVVSDLSARLAQPQVVS
jgi:hypothetical protein